MCNRCDRWISCHPLHLSDDQQFIPDQWFPGERKRGKSPTLPRGPTRSGSSGEAPDFQLILSVIGFSTGTAGLGLVELAQSNRLRAASAAMPPFDGLPGGNDAWRAEQQQRLTDLVSPERKFGPAAQEDPSS